MINRNYIVGAGVGLMVLVVGFITSYVMSNPHVVEQNNAQVTHTVTIISGADGVINPVGTLTLPDGGSQIFNIVPNAGFKIATITVDTKLVAATSSITLSDIRTDHAITVSYSGVNYATGTQYVSYKGSLCPGVDVQTFAILGNDHGRDRRGVFYACGERITEADPATFTSFDKDIFGFGKDKEFVFWANKRIYGADVTSFTVLGEMYARDKNSIYYTDKKVSGADLDSFVVDQDNGGYGRDKNSIYVLGQKDTHLATSSFKALGYGYAKDAHIVEMGGTPIEADSATFVLLGKGYYAKDVHSVFYQGSVISEIDPLTFALIPTDKNINLAQDKNGLYRDFTKLPLDTKTLKVLSSYYLADATHVYFEDKPLTNVDVSSFKILSDAFGVDKRGLWFGADFVAAASSTDQVKEGVTGFVYIGDLYVTDGVNVWYGSRKMLGVDVASFVVLPNTYYSYDKNSVYYGGEKIAKNSDGFVALDSGLAYAKTTTEVFFSGAKVPGADATSFLVDDDSASASDNYHKYYLGKVIATGGR